MTLTSNQVLSKLHDSFGFNSFRSNQEAIVQAILAKKDVFAVMPTGGGKSLCFQLPSLLMDGTTLVVSPLISLMKDQVDAARENGIRASFYNSSLSPELKRSVYSELVNNRLDLLYVSPERFAMEEFVDLLRKINLSFITVDEAHCISEWGHDFRPDYLALSKLKSLFPGLPIAAFTATATLQVQKSIVDKLNLENPYMVRASFDRPNLTYRVVPRESTIDQIVDIIKKNSGESGIIYRTTRKSVEATTAELQERGIKAIAYHAGLDDRVRHNNQEKFNRDEVDVVVATIAFGMGIDKSNVRFIVHADMPKNIEGYYQETGRAGRDGEPASCTLLFGRGDIPKLLFFIEQTENETERERGKQKLFAMVSFADNNICRRKALLGYFQEKYLKENCGACDICLGEADTEDQTVDAQKVLSAIARTNQRFGAAHISDVVTGANTKAIRSFGHNKLKTYGIGADHPKNYWRRVIDALLGQQVIVQSTDQYPTLQLTPNAREILKGNQTFTALKRKELPGPRSVKPTTAMIIDFNRELFGQLRALRREIAQNKNLPPFVIFSDRSLHEMACYMPVDESGFRQIHGVGSQKLEHYANSFLPVIQKFVKKNGAPSLRQVGNQTVQRIVGPKAGSTNDLSETFLMTFDLLKTGLTVDEVAGKRGLTQGTIYSHIERLIMAGKINSIDTFVSEQARAAIHGAMNKCETGSLKEIMEATGNSVGYEEIRLVKAISLCVDH